MQRTNRGTQQRANNLKVRALIFTLLLFGCEAIRIDEEMDTLAAQTYFYQLGAQSPVCEVSSAGDSEEAVKRYDNKCVKITTLSNEFTNTERCRASCLNKLRKIKKQLSEFWSCVEMAKSSTAPPDLQEAIMGSTNHSLMSTMTKVQLDVLSYMKKIGHFEASGACEFSVDQFNPAEAIAAADDLGNDPMPKVRSKLFGNNCTSEDAVRTYINSLSSDDAKVVTETLKMISDMLNIHRRARKKGESTSQEITELEADLEETGTSVLALGFPPSDEIADSLLEEDDEAESTTAFELLSFILTFIFFYCLFSLILAGNWH